MIVRVWNTETGFEDKEIDESEIVQFGIRNSKLWNKNGTFKKFFKKGFIKTITGEYLKVSEHSIAEMKEVLKGKYKAEKSTQTEYKNYTERKAIDWTFIIN